MVSRWDGSDLLKQYVTTMISDHQTAILDKLTTMRSTSDMRLQGIEKTFDDLERRFQRELAEYDRRHTQLYDAGAAAWQSAIISSEKLVNLAMSAAQAAVQKAELANEKRFENVNEFRGSMNDAQVRLMPRSEAEARLTALQEKIGDLNARVERREGATAGASSSQSTLIATAAVVITLVGVAFTIMNGIGHNKDSIADLRRSELQQPQFVLPQAQQPSPPIIVNPIRP